MFRCVIRLGRSTASNRLLGTHRCFSESSIVWKKATSDAKKYSGLDPSRRQEVVQDGSLLKFLQTLSAQDAADWDGVLQAKSVRSLGRLKKLARNKVAWKAFHDSLAQNGHYVLAAELDAWSKELAPREPQGK